MKPGARVLCDSISENGDRLTTLEVVMHRFVLAEFNTHRKFSRNSASSRAIPVEKQIKKVLDDPAIPLSWGKNQKGMQAEEELSPLDKIKALDQWLLARNNAVASARILVDIGVHKQITNRLLEPFMWHTAIVSSTEWENFFVQRATPVNGIALAQPEIVAVADAVRSAINYSKPNLIKLGQWHLPLISTELGDEFSSLAIHEDPRCRRISVARCARVSYLTHNGLRDIEEDLAMYDRLYNAQPKHKSPFEHVATPSIVKIKEGNFDGWHQLRHMLFGS